MLFVRYTLRPAGQTGVGLVAIIWALIAGRGRPGKGQISKAHPVSRNVRDEFLILEIKARYITQQKNEELKTMLQDIVYWFPSL